MNKNSGLHIFIIITVLFSLSLVMTVGAQDSEYNCESQTDVSTEECEALLTLFESTNGEDWLTNTGWMTPGVGPCSWYGIGCLDGQITSLNLPTNKLSGSLPNEIGALSGLVELRLNQNELSGGIPASIGQLENLKTIFLFNNMLSGNLPPEIGNLSALEDLHLNNNDLTGSLPETIGNLSNLQCLQLNQNALGGTLPASLGNLSNLARLLLNNNNFIGTIPQELGNLSKLETLDLRVNGFSGSIPPTIGNLSSLRNLYLNFNLLSGEIPSELGQLSNLIILQLSGNRLTGEIPESLGNLSQLIDLSLDQNMLFGSIPDSLGDLTALQGLRLNSNRLSGTLPPSIGNLSNLRSLNMAANQLSGEIPTNFVNLTTLRANSTQFDNNMLTVRDPALMTFLSQVDPNWQETQTIPPDGLEVVAVAADSVALSWNPITYVSGGGYFHVGYSVISGGPYIFEASPQTSDKSTTSLTVTGLQPNTRYHFVVRTVTNANPANMNQLISEPNQEIIVVTDTLPPTITEVPTETVTPTAPIPTEQTPTDTPVPTIEITPEPTETAPPEVVEVQVGTVSGETPTITWASPTAVPVDWYQLIITSATGQTVVDQWFQANNLCNNGVCTLTPEMLIPFGLPNGSYTLQVNVWSDDDGDGNGLVVSIGETTIDVAANNLIDTTSGRVILLFENDPAVTWVQVWIGNQADLNPVPQSNRPGDAAGWYEKATEMSCNETTCSLVTAAHPTNGHYVIYLRKWTGELSGWGGPFVFSVGAVVPDVPEVLNATLTNNQPTLTWNGSEGATWYQVWLGTLDPQVQAVHTQWHSALDLGCADDGICMLNTTNVTLLGGQEYRWYVQAWGPAGFSAGGSQGWAEGPVIQP